MNNEQKKIYLEKGKEFINSGNLQNAKDVFTECLTLDVTDTDFIMALANVEFRLKNFFKSKYLLQEAFKIKQSTKIMDSLKTVIELIEKHSVKEKFITASFIVKDEEECLADALSSIKPIADEIIVVDTGSTDNTVKIAESFGAKIYHFNWIDDYSAARNISIKYATSKWIIYLDADEILPAESKAIIRDLAINADDKIGGFICNIQSEFLDDNGDIGLHTGLYPRFFRNLGYPVSHFFGKIHEQISPSFIDRGYRFENSELVVKHNGYVVSKQEMQTKISGHLKILTEHVESEPENGFAWYHLGNTLYQMGLYKESKEILKNSLKCGNLSKYLSANTELLLSRVDEELGDLNSAFSHAHSALKYIKKYDEALLRKAEILNKMGRLDEFLNK
jgi:glycosyltransferase involved in cell wall biosynthesis